MNRVRIATSMFLLLSAVFVSLFAFSATSLPSTVATHFDGHGRPNAWMPSSSYLVFFVAIGVGLPVFIIALFYMIRWLPAGLINLPLRDFWLANERAAETHRYLLTCGLWLACMMLLFMLAVHLAVVRANQLVPPRLALQSILVPMGIFITALVLWIAMVVRHFTRAPSKGRS